MKGPLNNLFKEDSSRRQFLKTVVFGTVATVAGFTAACVQKIYVPTEPTATPTASPTATPTASPTATPAAQPTRTPWPTPTVGRIKEKVKLKVLAWGDKLNDQVNYDFKEKTGHTATFTIFRENPEAMAKIKADKTAFDTVFIDGLWANGHYNAGTIVPIDFKGMKIYDDYFPRFADFAPWQLPSGETLAIPHAWSADGILYNEDKVDIGNNPSMAILFDPKYEGKVAIYDSFYRTFLNVAPAVTSAGIFKDMHVRASIDGGPVEEAYDLSQSYLDQTLGEMLKARKNFKMIWQNIDEITRALVSGEIWIAIGGNYITQNCLDAGATNIGFATPAAHDIMGWVDGQCIIRNDQYYKNPDAVLDWLEHYHNAESQVKIIGNTWLASTSKACLDGLEKAFPDGKERVAKLAARDTAAVDRMSLLRPLANYRKFKDAWDEFLEVRSWDL